MLPPAKDHYEYHNRFKGLEKYVTRAAHSLLKDIGTEIPIEGCGTQSGNLKTIDLQTPRIRQHTDNYLMIRAKASLIPGARGISTVPQTKVFQAAHSNSINTYGQRSLTLGLGLNGVFLVGIRRRLYPTP